MLKKFLLLVLLFVVVYAVLMFGLPQLGVENYKVWSILVASGITLWAALENRPLV